MTPTAKQSLLRDIIRDLIVDVRCAERDGLSEYAAKCRADLRKVLPTRHAPDLDRYGWPRQLKSLTTPEASR